MTLPRVANMTNLRALKVTVILRLKQSFNVSSAVILSLLMQYFVFRLVPYFTSIGLPGIEIKPLVECKAGVLCSILGFSSPLYETLN